MTSATALVIDSDHVIDGISSSRSGPHRLLVQDGVIAAVGRPGEIPIPDDPGAIHLRLPRGTTLLPGLIDTHTHLTMNGSGVPLPPAAAGSDAVLLIQAAQSARTHLHSGVTTVIDAGARNAIAFDLVAGQTMGLVDAPRLRVAGQVITRTGGHAWPMGTEADGVDAIRTAARAMLKAGADFIKIMATGGGTPGTYSHLPTYSVAELRAAVDEAHEYGKIAVAHCSATEGHLRCIEAGMDIIYHGHFFDPDASLRFDEEVARRIADSPIHVNPTLWVNGGRRHALQVKAATVGLTDEEQRTLAFRTARYDGQVENVGKLAALGVKLIAGTDAGFALYPFGDIVTELSEMVRCGMSPVDVIAAATSRAATAFQLAGQTGAIAPGLSADLLVVEGDPSANIEALRAVRAVIARGTIVANNLPAPA